MKRFYVCAYGHSIRWSTKVDSEEQAALECFGTTLNVTVLDAGISKRKIQSVIFRKNLITHLKRILQKEGDNDE